MQKNAPKLVSLRQDLAKPALTSARARRRCCSTLVTIFVLVVLLPARGPEDAPRAARLLSPERAAWYSRIGAEMNRSVIGYMLGNFLTSLIAGVVVSSRSCYSGCRSRCCGRCGSRWSTSCR